jgi:hypothetical protein
MQAHAMWLHQISAALTVLLLFFAESFAFFAESFAFFAVKRFGVPAFNITAAPRHCSR